MKEDLAKSMTKARNLWGDGKYKESAQAMKTVGTLDAPSQVHLLLRLFFLAGFATFTVCSSLWPVVTGATQQASGGVFCPKSQRPSSVACCPRRSRPGVLTICTRTHTLTKHIPMISTYSAPHANAVVLCRRCSCRAQRQTACLTRMHPLC